MTFALRRDCVKRPRRTVGNLGERGPAHASLPVVDAPLLCAGPRAWMACAAHGATNLDAHYAFIIYALAMRYHICTSHAVATKGGQQGSRSPAASNWPLKRHGLVRNGTARRKDAVSRQMRGGNESLSIA